MIIDIDGQWWRAAARPAAGGATNVHRIDSMSSTYLQSFNLVLHPRGL